MGKRKQTKEKAIREAVKKCSYKEICEEQKYQFNLSEKMNKNISPDGFYFWKEDVKEFIKLIPEENSQGLFDELVRDQDLDKDEIVEIICEHFKKKIDKLAGDELL